MFFGGLKIASFNRCGIDLFEILNIASDFFDGQALVEDMVKWKKLWKRLANFYLVFRFNNWSMEMLGKGLGFKKRCQDAKKVPIIMNYTT